MEQPKGPAKEQKDKIDEEIMKGVKNVPQSKITDDDEDDEGVDLKFIDQIVALSAANKNNQQAEAHTPSFDEDGVDYDRDSLTPEIEEEIVEMEAILKSTVERPMSDDKVIEDVEVEPTEQELRRGRADNEEHDPDEPRSFDPDVGLPNAELPKWCRFPEPVPSDLQEESGCQDTGKAHPV